jgi:molybdenum cofactor guanylyltransferase
VRPTRRNDAACSCSSSIRQESRLTEPVPLIGPSLIGAVLTGGASRRMGRTKALVEVDGVPMAVRVAASLRAAGCRTVVAAGGDADELAPLGLELVPDVVAGQGPLSGILAVLERLVAADPPPDVIPDVVPDVVPDVFAVACDLPYLRPGDLGALVAHRASGVDVVVARTDRLEPTCAIWSISSLPSLRVAFAAGHRALHRVLGGLVTVEVEIAADSLRNINTPEDLGGYPSPGDGQGDLGAGATRSRPGRARHRRP